MLNWPASLVLTLSSGADACARTCDPGIALVGAWACALATGSLRPQDALLKPRQGDLSWLTRPLILVWIECAVADVTQAPPDAIEPLGAVCLVCAKTFDTLGLRGWYECIQIRTACTPPGPGFAKSSFRGPVTKEPFGAVVVHRAGLVTDSECVTRPRIAVIVRATRLTEL